MPNDVRRYYIHRPYLTKGPNKLGTSECVVLATDYAALQQQLAGAYEMAKARVQELEACVMERQWIINQNAADWIKEKSTLESRLHALEEALKNAPTGRRGETHGDVVARYYQWYEGERKQALATIEEV